VRLTLPDLWLTFSFIFIVIVITIIYKKYFFQEKNAIQINAQINKIKIHQIDNIWSPELEIFYSFYYNENIFENKNFLSIDYFLEDEQFLLINRNQVPILLLSDKELKGEEHIETYILSLSNIITIEFNLENPSQSRIYKKPIKKSLFQEIDITFPWLK